MKLTRRDGTASLFTARLCAFTTARHRRLRSAPPPAEALLEHHKDELPPRLNVG
ncbi:hypothetical protein [Dactylosporangium matsuzakiense]|uniref:Uncharacterized protein n=1 Tax=Dactylosporangium matsuzakiense TaxID=53360 RepID=A0A9W6KJ49_9ACTN|nr:hypothetical protein [Dactylosporangium matsuzakiense]UWZ48239.1 hypothetical protein Dmats_18625 [Dactylosporangium matsuzakiense]GLL01474.1 hypothetical protein GCM10017581_032150 [Dactylosporangium matsuzakiense]